MDKDKVESIHRKAYDAVGEIVEAVSLPVERKGSAPEHRLWKPGEIGWKPDEHGRRVRNSLLDDALKKALKRTQKNGRTVAENMALVMVDVALAGNVSMIKLICERTGGLPTVRVEEDTAIHVTVERIG